MASKYFVALFLFVSYSVQSMEIIDFKQKKEDAYVRCIAPIVASANKYFGSSQEDWEAVCRRNWKENKAERRNFKRIICAIASNDNDAVVSQEDYDVVARLWKKDAAFRMECQKCFVKQALAADKTFADLPAHVLNIIGGFTKRVGKDTLRCVNKAFNAQVLSQDALYVFYRKAKPRWKAWDTKLINQLSCYSTFTPAPEHELFDAIEDNNIALVKHCFSLKTYYDNGKRYDYNNADLYNCIKAAIKIGNSADMLEMLIGRDKKDAYFSIVSDSSMPLMLRAILCNDIPLIPVLIKYGVDINYAYHDGITALQYAVENGRPDVVKELIRYSNLLIDQKSGEFTDDWAKYNKTALSMAISKIKPYWIESDLYVIIRRLLKAGADPERATTWAGSTALQRVNAIVAEQINRPYSAIYPMSSADMRQALDDARSDRYFADLVDLIKQKTEEKYPLNNAACLEYAKHEEQRRNLRNLFGGASIATLGFVIAVFGYK